MAKPKRNEPCYCGSGLKYKKCHMRADQELERERREAVAAVRFLRQDLVDFAEDERFASAFAQALQQYWNGYYTLETADEMSEYEAQRFVDWFVFDYGLDEGAGGRNERLIETYRQERGDDLSSVQQEVIEQWLDAAPSDAYILTDYKGQTLHLQGFLSGDEVEVYEPAGRGNVDIGDVILARVLPVQDHLELSGGAAYLPQDEIADLREKLEAARATDAEAYPNATHDDFLRRHNHLLIHHALEQAERKGRPPVSRLAGA